MKYFVNILTIALLVFGFTAEGQERRAYRTTATNVDGAIMVSAASVRSATAELVRNELSAMDAMVRVYGKTDFSSLATYVEGNSNASPNDVIPFFAMGHAYLNRHVAYPRGNENLVKALDNFEIPARESLHRNWGTKWASSITAAYLYQAVARLRSVHTSDAPLQARIEALDLRAAAIVAAEEDPKLGGDLPFKPYVSGTSADGNTMAEENAWEAVALAWAANLYPTNPHAAMWDAKARELAFYSVVRRSEMVTLNGQSFSTVEDDYTLANHLIMGNCYYTVATVQLLRMGALAYHFFGRAIPAEFSHGVAGLYGNYRAMCAKDAAGRWVWTGRSDPVGDPTLFPLAGMGDDDFEMDVVRQKAADGYLWLPTAPVVGKLVIDPEKGLTPDSSLGTAIQNGKAFWYVLTGSYLWHTAN